MWFGFTQTVMPNVIKIALPLIIFTCRMLLPATENMDVFTFTATSLPLTVATSYSIVPSGLRTYTLAVLPEGTS